MRPLTHREQRTIRIAALGLGVYLALFFGSHWFRHLNQERREYLRLVQDARILRDRLEPYQDKVSALRKLMESLRLDPAKLTNATVVAEASAAIQKASLSGGIQLGPIRETPAHTTAKELTQIQFEGTGPVPAVLAFLHRLESIGYPLVVDAVQINGVSAKPGAIKLTLTLIILNFDQWKKGEAPHA